MNSYYNVDGVGELGIGFMCLSFASIQWLQASTPKDSVWNRMSTFLIFIGVMSAVIHYGSKAIKERITYPRTGFVEYPMRYRVWRPLILGAVVSMLASALLVYGVRAHWKISTPAALLGLLFAASYARSFARTVPWKWTVVWAMGLWSVAVAMLPVDVFGSLARAGSPLPAGMLGAWVLCMAAYGVILSISGAISFWLYLRHTQAPPHNGQ